jgi:tetratricopeptide (TPR) repeat protein
MSVFSIALGILIAFVGILVAHYWPPKPVALEQVIGKQGELVQKAPQSEFDREVASSAENLKKIATSYFQAAENDFQAQEYKAAAQNYAQSITAIPTMSAYLNEGIVLLNLSDRANAEDAVVKGLKISRDDGNKTFEVAFLNILGVIYIHDGKLSTALDTLRSSQQVAGQIGYLPGQILASDYIGEVYERQRNYDAAITVLRGAASSSTDPRLVRLHARALLMLGVSYLGRNGKGDIERARRIFEEQACPIFQQLGDTLGQALCYDNLGSIAHEQGDDEKAIESFSAAYKLYVRMDSIDGQAASQFLRGELFLSQGSYSEALEACGLANDLLLRSKELQRRAEALVCMARAHRGKRNYRDALDEFLRAMKLYRRLQDQPAEAEISALMTETRQQQSVGEGR